MNKECIREILATDAPALKRFVTLERRLLSQYPLYVPNFASAVSQYLTGKSAFTREMGISLFIASDGERDVARCAALINPKYQAAKDEKVGFIGYFAAAEGCEACVQALFEKAEAWLKEHGITRIIAPFNGSAFLGYGVRTDAFDEEPVFFCGWNPAYYAACFTLAGYRPAYPLLFYTTDFTSEKYRQALERAQASKAFQVRPINKKNWRADLEIFRQLINEAFVQEWEWYPATSDEFYEHFTQMKPVLDPRVMLIAEIQGKPAGVAIGYPDWNPLMRRCKGKFGLLQNLQFLFGSGHYQNAGHVFAAVRPEYGGMGIGRSLVVLLCHRYEKRGLNKAYGYTINEDNLRSRKMNEAIGGTARLLYHVYDKII